MLLRTAGQSRRNCAGWLPKALVGCMALFVNCHLLIQHHAQDMPNSRQNATTHHPSTSGVSRKSFRTRQAKNLVVVMSVSNNSLDILRLNAPHFMHHSVDLVLCHYDRNMTVFAEESWYDGLVKISINHTFRNKFHCFDELYKNPTHKVLLDEYDYMLIPDEDFLWVPVNLTCWVRQALPFGLVGPAVVGVHRAREQDPSKRVDGRPCPRRKVRDIEVQAPMIRQDNFARLASLLLPENKVHGELKSVWCLDFVWCAVFKGGCGIDESCGNPIHCNRKTLNKQGDFQKESNTACDALRNAFPPPTFLNPPHDDTSDCI